MSRSTMLLRRAPVAAVAVGFALVAAACSGGGGATSGSSSSGASSTTGAAAVPTTTTTPAATTGGPAGTTTAPSTTEGYAAPAVLESLRLGLEPVVTMDAPVAMATRAGTATVYVAERAGRVRPVDLAAGRAGTAILDISDNTTTDSERGLLGLAFSPDGATLFVSYTDRNGDSNVDAYAMRGDTLDTGSKRRILFQKQPFSNHNGGDIVVGPDGMLWFGLGDGGSQRDPSNNGQNTETLLGKILRIDPSRPSGDRAYGIPPDNPFANGGGAPEIWAYGLRNPWRFSFDRANGDLWIGDVGQNTWEEVDLLPAASGRGRGANLQWSLREGTHRLKGDAPEGSTPPVHEYDHAGGSCSVTGGYVYRGTMVPSLRGVYLFTDYCDGKLRALVPDGSGGAVARTLPVTLGGGDVASFGEGPDGELYVLGLASGQVRRLVAA